ncbi:ABC-type sugar transport system, periplasmic component [Sphaerochaeta pleomorpha str. Grapes]|uniref:ABC-type sugar transport system, periplasmic component n=1 Tax=Sphaerochaeta pleomorpha (strain ATCC BAA-1885 / DSM 22778 / Grapes) TaxID=158190 RepID=G8QU79_SPHPG|nr:autoinducer 2 ABC transporter substrate-binding protein [Sphaerochaeta pleomorpha]AEV28049.1 ABC-type sugar transport system, periplasmic component [Sphaerochaeta pleomorpha str. Grapes]
MKKKMLLALALLMVVATATFAAGSKETGSTEKSYRIAVVPKLTSIAWFQRMEVGVKEYAKATGVDAFYTGPSEGDGALQAQAIEDLISQGVDAICVVPFSTEALEPVLKKARAAGIVVISHEASSMTNIDYDIEAFNNAEYGKHFMDLLGQITGGKGQYIVTVGSLTSESHNQWVDAGIALQKQKYPGMSQYGDKIETADNQSTSYNKVKEVLTANPNIAGIQGSAMPDVAGAALAVEELGLAGKVKIAGTSLVSVAGKYVKDGTIEMISFWDPALAGKAMVQLAVKVLNGEQITTGANLGVTGYENLTLNGKVLNGQAWIDVTKANVDDPAYAF